MRKLIFLLILSLAAFAADAQRLLVTDIAKITQKLTLNGTNVTSISTDTTLASPTNNQLVTARAVRDYAWKIGGRPVSSTAPSSGEVLKWDGTKWAPATDGGGGGGDDWGTQVVETDGTLDGDGTAGDPLGWPGNFVSLPITGTGLSGNPLDILANSIDTSHIATNGVGADELRPGSVGSSELAQQGATSGQVLKWNGSAWAPGTDNGLTGAGTANEVAVYDDTGVLTSYPEMTFDGSLLQLGADLTVEKINALIDVRSTEASTSNGGGLVNIGAYDGAALASGDKLGAIQFGGNTGVGGNGVGASIEGFARGTWSGTNSNGYISMKTANNGSLVPAEKFRLTSTSNGLTNRAEFRNGTGLYIYGPGNANDSRIEPQGDSSLAFLATTNGELNFDGKFGFYRSDVTVSADRNNWYMGIARTVININPTGSNRTITGLQPNLSASFCRLLYFQNVSSTYSVIFANESVSSTNIYRFALNGSDFTLGPGEAVWMLYNDGLSRWTIPNKPGAGGGSYTDEQAQDAVGNALVDGSTIDLTYDDATPYITAEVKSNVIQTGGNTTGSAVTIGTNDANALNLEVNNTTGLSMGTDYKLTATAAVSNTNTVADRLVIQTNSTGSPSASFGGGILFQGESSTTDNRDMLRFSVKWSTATDGSRRSEGAISAVNSAGALTEQWKFNPATGLTISNSSGSAGTNYENSGISPGSTFTIGAGGSTQTLVLSSNNVTAANGVQITNSSNTATTTGNVLLGPSATNFTQTSGTRNYIHGNWGFAPTSGTAIHNQFTLDGTFNQTGGANGITRGVYLNENLTAVADFRALEIAANNSNAKGVYQTGSSTTNNFVGGTMFGSTSAPSAVAAVEVSSTTKGLLLPRMTTTQRDAITAVAGLVIFNTTTTKMECYDGTTWQAAW